MTVAEQHLADQRRSGLGDEIIAAAGLHSLSDGTPQVRVRLTVRTAVRAAATARGEME